MKKRKLVGLTMAICLGTAASSAFAHHSHPFFYDVCKTVTIEGRIEKVEFKDPHTLVFLKTDNGTAYTLDWAGLRGLTNNGWLDPAKASLVFGARISVTGARIRSTAEIREHFPEFTSVINPNTLDPALIRRVDNSWNWALQNPPVCKGK
jgi:hypothetical protein